MIGGIAKRRDMNDAEGSSKNKIKVVYVGQGW